MFILSNILNRYNDSTRKGGTDSKDRTCKAEISRIGNSVRDSKTRSYKLFNCRRFGKGNVSIRSKSQQCTCNTKESRIRVYLSLIPLFIFYNPQILITLIYIDSLFADELIAINIIQLNYIWRDINAFI